MIQILLVDDHPSVIEGTKLLIEKEEDMEVTVEISPYNAIDLIQMKHFDVMLFDLYMPHMNGIELTKKVLSLDPEAIILIYSGFEIFPHFNSLCEAGISGFISKTSTREQLITAIRCALRRETVIPLSLFRELRRVKIYMEKESKNKKLVSITITKREEEILYYVSKGKSNKEIAKLLLIGQRSLEYNLTAIFQKLGVRSRAEAVKKAKELGLLTEEILP